MAVLLLVLYWGECYAISNSFVSIDVDIIFFGKFASIIVGFVFDLFSGFRLFLDLVKCPIRSFEPIGESGFKLFRKCSFDLFSAIDFRLFTTICDFFYYWAIKFDVVGGRAC